MAVFWQLSPRGVRSKGDQQPDDRVTHNQKLQSILDPALCVALWAHRMVVVRSEGNSQSQDISQRVVQRKSRSSRTTMYDRNAFEIWQSTGSVEVEDVLN